MGLTPRWTVLVTAPRLLPVLDRYLGMLEAAGCEVRVQGSAERLSEDELMSVIADVDGVLCGDDQLSARVLAAAPRLRVISKWGTGVDSIDLQAAQERGIAVRNTPGAFSDAVADTALGYMLMFARGLDTMARDMRNGKWTRLPLRSLGECTVGIVGLGSIGRAVARRAAACGARILGYDVEVPAREDLDALGVTVVTLEALLSEAHFVTLHMTLRADSRGLIDRRLLGCMRPDAVLINTARGGLVDETALTEALQAKRIAGAALDVFATEPLPASSPLRAMDHVFLAPHNANASIAAAERVHVNSIRNLLRVLSESTPS